ncbi:hypothetical protein C922_03678 [Plasmodium inui San Antonio 1]|uniref:Uncharacterized protein n=1 Tax=Plasmodium inui San Antonio 1 TaxID=1237626 RepID=W7AKT8_9APIC|nr:hypothetical protein C922_03678 [Plasmodium inui San Antonio 1]EUD65951.1 hypothetical protein C922_03678 [Plasmodium inui San Antonio 1]
MSIPLHTHINIQLKYDYSAVVSAPVFTQLLKSLAKDYLNKRVLPYSGTLEDGGEADLRDGK